MGIFCCRLACWGELRSGDGGALIRLPLPKVLRAKDKDTPKIPLHGQGHIQSRSLRNLVCLHSSSPADSPMHSLLALINVSA